MRYSVTRSTFVLQATSQKASEISGAEVQIAVSL